MVKSMGKLEERRDISEHQDKVHLIYGLLRKKENIGVTKPIVVRQVIRDFELDKKVLKTRMDDRKGIWRIYQTVNARDVKKALKDLVMDYIKGEKDFADRVDSHWKTCLMQPKNKAEKKFLLDIDTKNFNDLSDFEAFLEEEKIPVLERVETINGYHFITDGFECRDIKKIDFVEIKRDGLVFIEIYDNRNI